MSTSTHPSPASEPPSGRRVVADIASNPDGAGGATPNMVSDYRAGDGPEAYQEAGSHPINGISESEGGGADSPEDIVDQQRLEDAYVGAHIASRYMQHLCHTSGLGWLQFDGRRWAPVASEVVGEVVRRALIEFHTSQARGMKSGRELQRIDGLLSSSKISAIQRIARNYLSCDASDFDKHPDLLNVSNGVVDLRTGNLVPHSPELKLTKVAPTDYLPNARHPDWDTALEAVPTIEAREWLQVRLGQGITGHPVPDDQLVVLKGSGSNGKTTIIDGVRESLGPDYAVTMPDRVLLARQGDHPTELMTLRGARLALMEEFPELGHLNVKRLKDALGTGEMTARLIAKDTVAWKPTHTPVVTTNYLPRVDESDDGTWRRLVLLEFPYRYQQPGTPIKSPLDRMGDARLRERLRNGTDGQHEAVLAWLISGAAKWYQAELRMPGEPRCVRQATQTWRRTSDVLLRYIGERLTFDSQAQVIATELFADFSEWLNTNGHHPWSDQNFSARLAQHTEAITNGVQKKRTRRSTNRYISRPTSPSRATTGSTLPSQFTVWTGLRFLTSHDTDITNDDNADPR